MGAFIVRPFGVGLKNCRDLSVGVGSAWASLRSDGLCVRWRGPVLANFGLCNKLAVAIRPLINELQSLRQSTGVRFVFLKTKCYVYLISPYAMF